MNEHYATEPINLCAGEFTPTVMASAVPDTWALVSKADSPEQCWLRPVVAWAWGSAELHSPTGVLLSESFTTALIDTGVGIATPAAELVASGYEVVTGPEERVLEEKEDRQG